MPAKLGKGVMTGLFCKEMKRAKTSPRWRHFVSFGLALVLLITLPHSGPGRALDVESNSLLILWVGSFTLLILGSFCLGSSRKLGIVFLGVGLLARTLVELKYSWLRSWWENDPELNWIFFPGLLTYYAVSFILPALLLLDVLRSCPSKNSGQNR